MAERRTHLRSVGELETAIDTTLGALTLKPEDEGAAVLARQYAQQIDQAEAAAATADRAIATLLRSDEPEDKDHEKYVYALAAKVEAKELLANLGPKLLAVLESIGATPAARAKLTKGVAAANAGPSQLDKLRSRRPAAS